MNTNAYVDLKVYLDAKTIETGTPLDVLIYKAFVGEPKFPVLPGGQTSRAPFFKTGCRLNSAPEPSPYSTNVAELQKLIKSVLPHSRILLQELFTPNIFYAELTCGGDRTIGRASHADMHVALLKAFVAMMTHENVKNAVPSTD